MSTTHDSGSRNLDQWIQELIKKERNKLVVSVIVFIAMGIFFAVVLSIYADPDSSKLLQYGMTGGLVAICIGLMIYGIIQYKRLDPDSSPLVAALHNHNRDQYIYWVYPIKHIQSGVVSYSIHLKAGNKRSYGFSIKEADYKEFIMLLSEAIPNAVFGFSEERKADFKQSPGEFLSKYMDA